MRVDGRDALQLRPIHIENHYLKHPEGSVLITIGDTKVICTASIEDRVPPFMRGSGKGWITAEYSMLPRATQQRNIRESSKGKVSGRTMEIQRLIGRALRAVVNLERIGEKTIWIDCDVIQADGGTRTASITGAFIAMTEALLKIHKTKPFQVFPITQLLAATSVGMINDQGVILDLNYHEDSQALVDMNVVMTSAGEFVELQGTGEEATFNPTQLNEMLEAAQIGLDQLFEKQKQTLGEEVVSLIFKEGETK
ncbi:ribonuclease PH [Bacillus ginsengihumi]|uniref:Ribonuclease PH n=1 Tax=Heyndrickxia ginsengihumi TaxID=363870 RepID=A0A0A6VHN3_9BACI|nr:ribonuclease PH [Heyndrickxia ginsengihumi]KHD86928.1 ribonuclease PH [Heyndrickxia ginsengihumi]MBE6182742.1 ribonuclease PH [Bacillus sp. (in: firmicutes)]MCM3021945.1 ribonuclease PH [Heyndrickxia ginsengihumi]NEY20860.1 ribonuclease PH [Heyndrickxia ginsengihumi]